MTLITDPRNPPRAVAEPTFPDSRLRLFTGLPRTAAVLRGALLIVTAFIAGSPLPLHAAGLVHHDLVVVISPVDSRIQAKDTIALPEGAGSEAGFILHADMKPFSPTRGARLEQTGSSLSPASVPYESYTVFLPPGANAVTIEYGGVINHPLRAAGREQAGGVVDTPGLISPEGVFLTDNSFWYPRVGDALETFSLTVHMPPGWVSVSQGTRTARSRRKSRWEENDPQEEIYLVASPFTEYDKSFSRPRVMAFLRKPDQALASGYLSAAQKYIAFYGKLIGPYPYEKFALVENFWETGFGMPSFTLLGPEVIRLPFILYTSYPHEILHNWWGNGVYVQEGKGNWSEGLTAYLADHLWREQEGAGAEYRLTTLQKYADYVQRGKDFPLTRFTSRHSRSTEAVGYGKGLMFFHMLRRELGDGVFLEAVRDFYRKYRFRFAAFDDLEESFEAASGKDLEGEFEQWTGKTGAPELRLSGASSTRQGDHYLLTAELEQIQPGDAYRLRVPIAVTVAGRERAYQSEVNMEKKRVDVSLPFPARPLRLDVDPEFDIFRRLGRNEVPPAISHALGAARMLVILPSAADKDLLEAYNGLARALAASGPDQVDVRMDSSIERLPADRAVAVLGWKNRFVGRALLSMIGYDLSVKRRKITIGRKSFSAGNYSVVLASLNPKNKGSALLFIASDRAAALPGLGRKLPHYHKYSYLVFEGGEPSIVAKGRWRISNSPLTAFFSKGKGARDRVEMGALAPRAALAPPSSQADGQSVNHAGPALHP
jgi:Peptidase family M1 domain